MNYIETCTKLQFSCDSRAIIDLKSVLHVRPGWIIYQNMRETWEKKVMKFEREIPIGLDAREKKWTGGGGGLKKPPPPNGIRVNNRILMLLKCHFSGLHFCILSKRLITCRAMQLRIFKVEPLFNNAFNMPAMPRSLLHIKAMSHKEPC